MVSEFWQTLLSGLAVLGIGGIAGFLWRSDRRSIRTEARLDSHEKTCAERYGQILEQNRRSEEHQGKMADSLEKISNTVTRLDENLRVRERIEDRG